LRELTGVSESDNQQWSQDMEELLIGIKKCMDETRDKSDGLWMEQIKNFEAMYDSITKMGLEENQSSLDPHIQPKKRGKRKQTKVKNLLDRFIDYKGDILRFMYDFEVPFENNQAERDVRMMKVQQKISGTFRSTQGSRSFCRIRGYISTVKKNTLSVIHAIKDVFNGKPFFPSVPIA
jgi:transposase